jgi:ribose transport system permease protein
MKERQQNLRLYLPVYSIAIIIYIFAGIIEPAFFSWNNNVNLFIRITPLIFAGIAQTVVILSGGIDLSIGSMIGLTNVLAASLPFVGTPLNILLWLTIPPIIGLLAGLVNGVIIVKGKFPPLIVTLATGAIFQGITLLIMPIPGGKISLTVARFITGTTFNIPNSLIIFLSVFYISYFILKRTEFGRSVYAIGGNEAIAYESGIKCETIKTWVYGISGLLAGLTGMFLSAWIFSADPLIGGSYVLNSIAVSVISGTSLIGGIGGVSGIIGGAYIFHLISNILNLLGISTFYHFVAKGLVLILALAISSSTIISDIQNIILRLLAVLIKVIKK